MKVTIENASNISFYNSSILYQTKTSVNLSECVLDKDIERNCPCPRPEGTRRRWAVNFMPLTLYAPKTKADKYEVRWAPKPGMDGFVEHKLSFDVILTLHRR